VKYVAGSQKLEVLGTAPVGSVITVRKGLGSGGPVLGTKTVKADGGFGVKPTPIANPGTVTVLSSSGAEQRFTVNTSCTLLPL
jgi:hypothetical protein